MTSIAARPLLAGRTLALLGIVLIGLNLRTAVAVISPIVRFISEDIPLTSIGIGLLGMLAPLSFALSGLVAPAVARRIGLEATMLVACAAMVIGPVVRALAPNYAVLVGGSVLLLGGMGFANIMLPPIIKRYFPDRIGALTATYATLMAIGASVPPLIAAPLAESIGWRFTLGSWAILALAAAVPWFVLWLRRRRRDRVAALDGELGQPPQVAVGRMWRSPVAWAITVAFMIPSFNVYAMFAWLPEIATDLTGATPAQAGAMVALFTVMGLPFALIVPVIAPRLKNVGWLIALGVTLFVTGYLGLLLAPAAAIWLWVILIGGGPIVFPLTLTLLNLRTRSHQTAVALSGFVQGIGYGGAALGPLVVGFLHDVSGSWTVPLVFLVVLAAVALVPAFVLARPRMVDDDLEDRP
jgi:CP family cyanate transporter-like MFS transporter